MVILCKSEHMVILCQWEHAYHIMCVGQSTQIQRFPLKLRMFIKDYICQN